MRLTLCVAERRADPVAPRGFPGISCSETLGRPQLQSVQSCLFVSVRTNKRYRMLVSAAREAGHTDGRAPASRVYVNEVDSLASSGGTANVSLMVKGSDVSSLALKVRR